MEIYVLRHGIAETARPGMKDSERALTSEGREKLRRVLKRAKSANVEPGLILSSPYRRALETAEVAAKSLDYSREVVSTAVLVPDASPQQVWEEIRSRRDETSLLLAGHEPLLSTLVAFLLNSPALVVDMKKGALVRIDCDRLTAQPQGVLKWMLTPATAID